MNRRHLFTNYHNDVISVRNQHWCIESIKHLHWNHMKDAIRVNYCLVGLMNQRTIIKDGQNNIPVLYIFQKLPQFAFYCQN